MTKPASQFTQETQGFESLAGAGLTASSVDAVAGVIRGVKVIGFESANGRVYPPDVLKRSVHLYENAKVFIDHKDSKTGRSYQERFGTLKGARFVEGKGIYADHHFNPKHPTAEQYLWDAQNAPDSVGFSHTAMLRFAAKPNREGKKVVEEIGQVLSVDLVADPATTKGLFESHQPAETEGIEMDLKELTLEQLTAARPDLIKMLESKSAEADKIKLLTEQLAESKKQLDQWAAKEKVAQLETAIKEELAAAGLDATKKEQVSDVFPKQLVATEDAAVRKELITDRAALVKAVPPTTEGQQGNSGSAGGLPTKPVTGPSFGSSAPAPSIQRIRESCADPKKFAAMNS